MKSQFHGAKQVTAELQTCWVLNYLQETIKYLSPCKAMKVQTDKEDRTGILRTPTIRYLQNSCV